MLRQHQAQAQHPAPPLWPYLAAMPVEEAVDAAAAAVSLRRVYPLTSQGLGVTQEGFLGQNLGLLGQLQRLLLRWHSQVW